MPVTCRVLSAKVSRDLTYKTGSSCQSWSFFVPRYFKCVILPDSLIITTKSPCTALFEIQMCIKFAKKMYVNNVLVKVI